MGAIIIRPGNERRAFEAMAHGGMLYVYTGERGHLCPPPWPAEGSGAIVYDGPPQKVGRRIVRRLQNAGTEWCPTLKAEIFPDAVSRKVRAILAGRDVMWIASEPSA